MKFAVFLVQHFRKAVDGDKQIRNEIIEGFYPRIRQLVAVAQRPTTEDDIQDSVLLLLEKFPEFRIPKKTTPEKLKNQFLTWAGVIIKNHFCDERKEKDVMDEEKIEYQEWENPVEQAGVKKDLPMLTELFSTGMEKFENFERLQLLEETLNSIDPLDRDILVMKLVDYRSFETIATLLHVDEHIIRRRFHKVLEAVKTKYVQDVAVAESHPKIVSL